MPYPKVYGIPRPQPAATSPAPRAVQRQALVTHPPVMVHGGGRRIVISASGVSAPVGSVEIRPGRSGTTEIVNLNVAPEFRRQGIGKQLVSAAVQAAGGPRAGIVLEAHPVPGTMQPNALVAMYQKMGFRVSGQSIRGNPVMALGLPGGLPKPAVAQRATIPPRPAAPPVYRPVFAAAAPAPPVFRPHALPLQPKLAVANRPVFPAPPAASGKTQPGAIQRMQTGREVTHVPSFGFDDQQGNTVPSHHHNTMEQFVTTYRVAESGHTNWDTQKQFASHRNRCAACVGVYAEDQAGNSYIFSRDVIYDGCANLYSSGDGKETNAKLRPEIREVSHSGGTLDLNQTRREYQSPALTQYESNIGGYTVKVNVVDAEIVKANLMALNAWGMNKRNTGGSNVRYTAASHHHSEQVIVIALQGSDREIAQWLENLIQTNTNLEWLDYTIMVHSEREMCANCAKAFNGYIQHPLENYKKTWKLIKQHFTYVPTASFQVSSRVDFNQNRTQPATATGLHGHQTFVTPPSHTLAQNVAYPNSQNMDDIYG